MIAFLLYQSITVPNLVYPLQIHNLRTVIVTADIHQGLYSASP